MSFSNAKKEPKRDKRAYISLYQFYKSIISLSNFPPCKFTPQTHRGEVFLPLNQLFKSNSVHLFTSFPPAEFEEKHFSFLIFPKLKLIEAKRVHLSFSFCKLETSLQWKIELTDAVVTSAEFALWSFSGSSKVKQAKT